MADRISVLSQELPSDTIRLVFALTFFVLHDPALQIEFFLIQDAKQMSHAVAFREEHIFEHRGGHVFKIIGAVAVSGAVQVASTNSFHGVDVGVVEILAAAEHKVFEKVGKARFAGFFVLRTDVVPSVYSDDGRFVIFVDQDSEPVGENKLSVGNIGNGNFCAGCGGGMCLCRRRLFRGRGVGLGRRGNNMENRDRQDDKKTCWTADNSISQGHSSGSKRQCDAKKCGNESPNGSSDEYFTFCVSAKQSWGFVGRRNSMILLDGVVSHWDWPTR